MGEAKKTEGPPLAIGWRNHPRISVHLSSPRSRRYCGSKRTEPVRWSNDCARGQTRNKCPKRQEKAIPQPETRPRTAAPSGEEEDQNVKKRCSLTLWG